MIYPATISVSRESLVIQAALSVQPQFNKPKPWQLLKRTLIPSITLRKRNDRVLLSVMQGSVSGRLMAACQEHNQNYKADVLL